MTLVWGRASVRIHERRERDLVVRLAIPAALLAAVASVGAIALNLADTRPASSAGEAATQISPQVEPAGGWGKGVKQVTLVTASIDQRSAKSDRPGGTTHISKSPDSGDRNSVEEPIITGSLPPQPGRIDQPEPSRIASEIEDLFEAELLKAVEASDDDRSETAQPSSNTTAAAVMAAASPDVAQSATTDPAEPEPQTRSLPVRTAVNMRSGPSNRASVITVVPRGSPVDVIGCKYWCEVLFAGKRGWIYKGFIQGR